MVGFLLGLGFGFGLHFAWCKWGDKCDCKSLKWRNKK